MDRRMRLPLALAALLALPGCASEIDGPTPAPTKVTNQNGTSVICTCDALQGCDKDENDVLTITGTGFAPLPVSLLDDPTLELPTVTFKAADGFTYVVNGVDPTKNDSGVSVAYKDDTTLVVTLTPAAVKSFTLGKYDIIVENPNGRVGELPDGLEVTAGPVLESVTPKIICDQLDTTITLKGKNFRSGAKVLLEGKALATAKVVDSSTITAVVPKGTADGKKDVTVENPEGCSSTLTDAVEVVPPPTVTKVEPATVCTGGNVTITGTGFLPGASVTIGSVTLTGTQVTVNSSTSITVNVGPMTPGGPYDVSVKNADGCSSNVLSKALTVTQGPIIVAVDPSTVYNKVAFPISIYGSGFKSTTTATVDTSPPTNLTIKNVTSDKIDAIVPAGIAPGTYDVTVKEGSCTYTFKGALVVTDQLTVKICGIDPPFGYTGENTPVTITGSGATCTSTATKPFVSTPRAWLDVNGTLHALKALVFVTSTSLTGVVPSGLTVGGGYDLLVQNPDGSIGLLEDAFKVVSQPVPQITAINPGDVDTQYNGTLTLTGLNFRSPGTVQVISETGAKSSLTGVTVASSTTVTSTLNVAGLALATGAYVVRFNDTTQGTYADYSALAVTNPSGKLGAWATANAMTTARCRHALVAGRVSAASRYLYAINGASGNGTPIDSMELVALDKFGGAGTWTKTRYKPKTARTGLVALARGKYLWVLGGKSTTADLKTLERAAILMPAQAPEITSFSFTLVTSGLKKGAWIYRVAAVMPTTDTDNPGGETLPSDPVVLHTIDNVKVSLAWKAVPTATSYVVYRSPSANAAYGKEELLASNVLTTTYEDDGTKATSPTQTPLVQGSTGVFVEQTSPTLVTARTGAALAVAKQSSTLYVYLAGGKNSTGSLSSVEYATLASDGSSIGTFATATQVLPSKSERGLLVVGDHDTSPLVPLNTTYLFAVGGHDGTAVYKDGSSSLLGTGGQPGAWTAVAEVKNKGVVGAVGYMVNNTLYFLGGSPTGTTAQTNAMVCEFTTPPVFQSCSSLAAAQLPSAKMNAALTLESAYFYITGGGGTDTTATTDVLKTVY